MVKVEQAGYEVQKEISQEKSGEVKLYRARKVALSFG